MAATHSIWIPSTQKYVGFGKLTTKHQLQLAQSVELSQTNTFLDFERNLADIITELSAGAIVGEQINVYDKVAITLQLAVLHVGDINKIHYRCPNCKNENDEPVLTSIKYSLSDFLRKLQPVIDKDPQQTVTCGEHANVMLQLDVIPTGNLLTLLHFQSQLHDTENIAMLSWIRSINIGTTVLDFQSFTYPQSLALFDKLSIDILLKVRQFISKHTAETPTLVSLVCGSCHNKQQMQFNLTSIPQILQSALHLDLESIYSSIFQLTTIGICTDSLSPAERDVYTKMHQQQQINKQHG